MYWNTHTHTRTPNFIHHNRCNYVCNYDHRKTEQRKEERGERKRKRAGKWERKCRKKQEKRKNIQNEGNGRVDDSNWNLLPSRRPPPTWSQLPIQPSPVSSPLLSPLLSTPLLSVPFQPPFLDLCANI